MGLIGITESCTNRAYWNEKMKVGQCDFAFFNLRILCSFNVGVYHLILTLV